MLTNASCSQNIKKLGANNQADQTIDSLNNCYHSLKDNDPDKLYNGFLVLNMTHESNSHPKTKISGKVILIYENYVNGDFRIPPTTDDAVVVVYLKNGANNIMPPDGHNKFNYFIYSEADIEQLINFKNGAQISKLLSKLWCVKTASCGLIIGRYKKSSLCPVREEGTEG